MQSRHTGNMVSCVFPWVRTQPPYIIEALHPVRAQGDKQERAARQRTTKSRSPRTYAALTKTL